jgi:hypothetical protein
MLLKLVVAGTLTVEVGESRYEVGPQAEYFAALQDRRMRRS